jgi:UDP-N-acetylmuramoyl-L-alanyl-D-glutamate--2,6-diaminopimelate ligase
VNLKHLLNTHGHLDWRDCDPEAAVSLLCMDSRQVCENSVYVAIPGHTSDGHDFLQSAIESGAIALVVQDVKRVPQDYRGAVLEVLDTRLTLQTLSQRFYETPGDQMLAIAVTGTNGKTSLSYIIEYFLNQLGENCGVIGTIDHHLKDHQWKTSLTSPDPITLQKRLKDFVENGASSFVIEASSHALDQSRIQQGFDATIFSNLSRDHLDYHGDMETYFLAKAKLFQKTYLKEDRDCVAIINIDDSYGQKLIPLIEGRKIYRYGQGGGADLRWAVVQSGLDGTLINITIGDQHNFSFQSPLIGEHNVYNVVAGLTVIYSLQMDVLKAANSFHAFPGIPGRMQRAQTLSPVFGFVDYAHTPDALEKAIQALRPLIPKGKKLITVFGCGGDRDAGKRPLMGELATRLSDFTIITSDNPRTEDPAQIISDICSGFIHKKIENFMPCLEREEAIEQAVQRAEEGDVILVAGKGHEDYQIIGTEKKHFDDSEVLKKYLDQKS